MAYIPTNWANGDLVTSEKLNKAEQAIKNSYEIPANVKFIKFTYVEHYDEQTDESTYEVVCDLTPNEYYAEVDNGNRFIGILTFSFNDECYVMNRISNGFVGCRFEITNTPIHLVAYTVVSCDNEWNYHVYE